VELLPHINRLGGDFDTEIRSPQHRKPITNTYIVRSTYECPQQTDCAIGHWPDISRSYRQ
jgi:hypothetical protein